MHKAQKKLVLQSFRLELPATWKLMNGPAALSVRMLVRTWAGKEGTFKLPRFVWWSVHCTRSLAALIPLRN